MSEDCALINPSPRSKRLGGGTKPARSRRSSEESQRPTALMRQGASGGSGDSSSLRCAAVLCAPKRSTTPESPKEASTVSRNTCSSNSPGDVHTAFGLSSIRDSDHCCRIHLISLPWIPEKRRAELRACLLLQRQFRGHAVRRSWILSAEPEMWMGVA